MLIVPRINSLVFSLSPSYMHTGFSLLFCYLANLQQKVQPWLWGFVSYTVWIKSGSFPSNSWNIVVCLFTNSGIPSGLQILSWSCIFCATLMWKDKISACLPLVTQWYFARHWLAQWKRIWENQSLFFSKAGLKTRDYISVSVRCNIIYIAKKKKKKGNTKCKELVLNRSFRMTVSSPGKSSLSACTFLMLFQRH